MKIGLVIPCYNEEESLKYFYKETTKILKSMNCEYELLFVNDGSIDNTLNIIKKLANDSHVKYISFSRNFGKESAMYAGICNVDGDYVAVIDADMQDPPKLLPEMVSILETGEYDSVATRRENRFGEPKIRSWFARLFYKIMNRISETDIVDGARDYRLMKREMADAIISMKEYNRFSKGIYGWIGFRTYWLSFKNVERIAGETKWNFWKLFKYAIDGIINFSTVPLTISSYLGFLTTILSILAFIFIVVRKIVFGDPVSGWPSLVCIIVFWGGVQLLCIGMMGQYISKLYLEAKKRPHYIIKETNKMTVKKVD